MLIVSQDKEEIINFDNIINITLLNDSTIENNNGYDIWVGTNQPVEDNYRRIGTYATKERAKTVLNEIIKRIVMTERFAAICIPERQDTMVIESYDNDEPLFIYHMPKE